MTALVVAKVTFVFALAWLVLACLGRASAALRHVVIVVAFIAALLLPLFELVVPDWRVLPRPAVTVQLPEPAAVVVDTASPAVSNSVPAVLEPAGPRLEPTVPVEPTPWLLRAWQAGGLGLLGLLLIRILSMQLTSRRAMPLEDARWTRMLDDARAALGIEEPVALRLRDNGAMPTVWGVRRPVVLLPRDCLDWSDARCRDVLAHELAHIARRDVPLLLLGHLACALHWFHPLAWLLKRRLHVECEHACDDLALRQGAPATRYADHLLSTAAEFHQHRSIAPVMAARSQLEGRIMAILERDKNRVGASLRLQFAVAAIAVAALVPLSSLTWASGQDGSSGKHVHVHVHDHQVVHEVDHEYSESDSDNFARHLDTLGVNRDDVDALLVGLGDANVMTRGASAWALGRSDDPRVVEPLVQAGYDAEAIVRQWAVRSLKGWPEPRVARMLADRVGDSDAEVRQWAVRTLNGHEPEYKTQPLITALGDADAEVREWAARSLAGIRNDAAQAAMGSRLGVESDESVSEWLVRSIDPGAPGGVEALVAATANESSEVRQWAVRGLAGRTNALAVDTMIGMLGDRNAEVREWSARGLATCGNERAIAPLQALEQDPNSEVREWAGRAIEGIRCGRAQVMR